MMKHPPDRQLPADATLTCPYLIAGPVGGTSNWKNTLQHFLDFRRGSREHNWILGLLAEGQTHGHRRVTSGDKRDDGDGTGNYSREQIKWLAWFKASYFRLSHHPTDGALDYCGPVVCQKWSDWKGAVGSICDNDAACDKMSVCVGGCWRGLIILELWCIEAWFLSEKNKEMRKRTTFSVLKSRNTD